jgi:hypothetical protein
MTMRIVIALARKSVRNAVAALAKSGSEIFDRERACPLIL